MIKFYRGLRASYSYSQDGPLQDAIFFATDTGEILINNVAYGIDTEKIKDVSFSTDTNIITFTKADDTTYQVDLSEKLLTQEDKNALDSVKEILESGELSVTYNSNLDGSVATVEKLGGIAAGTKVSDLDGMTISSVLDTLIFPTIQPTVVAPSASISLKSGVANIKEVGSTGYTEDDFTTSYNPGSIMIGSTKQNDRAGALQSDVIYAGSESNGIPATISAGTANFYYKVNYAAGPAPLDSKGQPATSYTALQAGSVTSAALATYGVYPFFANVQNDTVSKLALTNATTFTQQLAAEGPNKHVFKLPHTITKIEMLNTLSNQYEEYGLENFTVTQEQIEVQSNSVQYNVYTRNDAGFNGVTTYRITYSK